MSTPSMNEGSSQPWVELINGDCRHELAHLEADVVIADPPYGDTSLPWDRRPAAGWVEAVAQCLKPNGSLWVFGSLRYLAGLWAEIEAAGFKYSQDVVWEKQNGTGFAADRFRRVHEHAALFYRGKWSEVYHDTQYSLDATARRVTRRKGPTHTGAIGDGEYLSVTNGPRMVRSVIKMANEHGRAIHPTQKPVELVKLLVQYSSPPGGIVVAPFAGSGTVCLAARETGRHAFGTETDPAYFDAACARLGLLLEAAE